MTEPTKISKKLEKVTISGNNWSDIKILFNDIEVRAVLKLSLEIEPDKPTRLVFDMLPEDFEVMVTETALEFTDVLDKK
jgi:hypothetical protein